MRFEMFSTFISGSKITWRRREQSSLSERLKRRLDVVLMLTFKLSNYLFVSDAFGKHIG